MGYILMLETLAAEFLTQILVLLNIQDGRQVFKTARGRKSCHHFYIILCTYTERGLKTVLRLKLNIFVAYYFARNIDITEKCVSFGSILLCVGVS
jgi:hypothetical protein